MIETDYPRPHLYRPHWRKLDGTWAFDFFDDYLITQPEDIISKELRSYIQVPFTYQCSRSGLQIHEHTYHPCMVYKKKITFTDSERQNRLLLHFGAVDFFTRIWIEDTCIGSHEGGYSPFSFEITSWTTYEEITVSVEVIDTLSPEQPRGKQTWGEPFSCWYPPVSGIWQSVWLETVPDVYISNCRAEPVSDHYRDPFRDHSSKHSIDHYNDHSIDHSEDYSKINKIALELELDGSSFSGSLSMGIFLDDKKIQEKEFRCSSYKMRLLSDEIEEIRYWDIDRPHLYRIVLRFIPQESFSDNSDLSSERIQEDTIETYTAFRTVEWKQEGFFINGRKTKMRLVLNQGYWPESGYTAPYPSAFKDDIELMKQLGFNGCRMHMKFEDPRFYYWADKLGFYVWEEAPAFYEFTENAKKSFKKQFLDIIERDKMHPSVITWVICNESWGIRDILERNDMYAWLKHMIETVKINDPSRPVIDNDGWEHVKGQIMTFHSYEHDPQKLAEDWKQVRKNRPGGILHKPLCIDHCISESETLMLTEFGGISYLDKHDTKQNWGYGEIINDPHLFFEKVKDMIETAESLPQNAGWCYTQFTDVHAEKNGLVFADRTPKFEVHRLYDILEKYV